jgi:hypothetical protein
MSAHKVIRGLVAIAAVIVGAVAIARSSADTNTSSFPKTRLLAATCPKLEWPYGCDWRPANDSGIKHLSARSDKRRRLYMRFFE